MKGLYHEDVAEYTPQASDYLIQTLARIDKDLNEEGEGGLDMRLSANLRSLDDLCTNLKLSLLDQNKSSPVNLSNTYDNARNVAQAITEDERIGQTTN